mgnify:CR=1 FL=1
MCNSDTSFPGKQPISSNLSGISRAEVSFIIAFCPFFKSATVTIAYLDLIKTKVVNYKCLVIRPSENLSETDFC